MAVICRLMASAFSAKTPLVFLCKQGARVIRVELRPLPDCEAESDLKTSSWIATPQDTLSLSGALFCVRRHNTVFVFHNGADSYDDVRDW